MARPEMQPEAIRTLESLAEMVSSQLELRKLRKTFNGNGNGQRRARAAATANGAGRARPTCARPWTRTSLCSITSQRSISPRARSSAWKLSFAGFIPSAD